MIGKLISFGWVNMLKTKIAFVTNQMVMGGIEKSLISLLKNIPTDRFDLTVFVMEPGGELLEQLPGEIKVKYIFGNEKTTIEKMWKYAKKGKFITSFKVGFYTFLLKRGPKSSFDENIYYSKMLPIVDSEYDLAVAYYIPASLSVIYVMNNMKAKNRVAWLHGDVTEYGRSLPKYGRIYEKYNHIFGVSHYIVQKFSEMFPYLKEKTSLFYNILDKRKMELLALENESYSDTFDGVRILTVGRLEMEKGQDLIPRVLSKLLTAGYHVRWYCVGDGLIRSQLESTVKEYRLEDNLFLLGTKENPYPFIRDCDIYIQPSRHEAYCITIAEARAFNKPIITTNTGASEQITNGETGLVIKFDEQEIYEAIKRLVDDETLRKKFQKNLSMELVDTTNEIEKLYRLTEKIS